MKQAAKKMQASLVSEQAAAYASAGLKARAHQIVDALPDKAGWEELMYQVYVEQALDRGLADVKAGRVIEHSKLLAKFGR